MQTLTVYSSGDEKGGEVNVEENEVKEMGRGGRRMKGRKGPRRREGGRETRFVAN